MLTEQEQFLPLSDNTPEGLSDLRKANRVFRLNAWPQPFDFTKHRLKLGDARDLFWIPDASIHLVVTSPPYWILKRYHESEGQLGQVENYEQFLAELDKCWRECARVLVPGGESAASSVTFASRVKRAGGISLCRFLQTFRSALEKWDWTA